MAALDAQTVTLPAEATFGRVIAELAGELDRLHRRRATLAEEIEGVFLAHPFGELLVSLAGIGPRTGARILAEIGDGSRFANGSKLASYAGLAPVTRQSGTSLKGESKCRRGNHRLKNAMFLAAFASLRDPESKAFTTGNEPRARSTTPRSSAWLGGAATSSSPCSGTTSATSPRRSGRSAKPPARLPGLRDYPLTRTWGHPPERPTTSANEGRTVQPGSPGPVTGERSVSTAAWRGVQVSRRLSIFPDASSCSWSRRREALVGADSAKPTSEAVSSAR